MNLRSATAICLATTCFTLSAGSQGPPGPEKLKTVSGGETSVTEFERVVTSSMQKAGVTGLSVAILNDGRIVYSRQFGWRDKDAGTVVDAATIFAAGSLSKPVFAYLVLALAADGLIDLNKPLQQYLVKPLAEYARYADLASDERFRAITGQMVLSHTTGLPNLRSDTADGRLRIIAQPGSRFGYSGEAVQLLQLVVEEITRSNLETLARERVFAPLRMSTTSYVWRDAFARNIAAPHNEFEWPGEPDRPATADAAGSMMTTADDYARFLAGILGARDKGKKSVDMMLTPAVRVTSPRMFGSRNAAVSGTNDDISLSWGFGWGLFETPHGSAFFHTGHKGGVQNYAVVHRDRGIGIVLLSNSDNFESVAREIVAAGIGDTWSPFDWLGYEPYDPARKKTAPARLKAIQVAAGVIAQYAGSYRYGGTDAVTHIKADGNRLFASDDGQSWDELLATSETVFFFRGRTLTVTFTRDASGIVTGLVVDNDGRKIAAQRVR